MLQQVPFMAATSFGGLGFYLHFLLQSLREFTLCQLQAVAISA